MENSIYLQVVLQAIKIMTKFTSALKCLQGNLRVQILHLPFLLRMKWEITWIYWQQLVALEHVRFHKLFLLYLPLLRSFSIFSLTTGLNFSNIFSNIEFSFSYISKTIKLNSNLSYSTISKTCTLLILPLYLQTPLFPTPEAFKLP